MEPFHSRFAPWFLVAALAGAAAGVRAGPLEIEREWAERVAPVLDRHCFKCHGGVRQRGGLDARSLEQLLKGGDSGPALIPGHAEDSSLFKFLHPDSDPHMPPKKQLDAAEIEAIKQWVSGLPSPKSLGLDLADASWQTNYPLRLAERRTPVWSPDAEISASEAIDNFVELGWRERNLRGAGPSTDQAFARRVYLDLAGRIPTPDELEEFLRDTSANRREKLVDALLAGEDYPRHFREVFDAVLMGRKGERWESQRQENGWFSFLESAFRENRPWNQVVRQIILARSDEPSEGADWFLYERRNNYQEMAEAVAPLAYGVKIGCAQCHNHPLAWEVEQRHYWGLVAAFNRGKNIEAKDGKGVAESAVGGFVNFENLKKQAQPALLAFLNGKVVAEPRPADRGKEQDGPELYLVPPPSEKEKPERPSVPKFSRREALADAATQDKMENHWHKKA